MREALELSRSTLGPKHSDTLTSLNNLAVLLGAQGKLGEAEPLMGETLEVRRATLGEISSMSNLWLSCCWITGRAS